MRDPFLDERHARLRERARALSLAKLEPLEERAESDLREASRQAVRAMGDEGLFRAVVPEAHGGDAAQVEVRAVAAAREGVAYGSPLADALLALQGLGSLPISFAGAEEQKRAWLPKVAQGRAIAGFALTEPGAGSDVAAMRTRATRVGDEWELTGEKTFISNAGLADFYTLFAKTDPDAGHRGISAFLVPADGGGLSHRPLKLLANHPIGTLTLERARLPRSALLGAEGDGFKLALRTLDRMRSTVAAAACGMAWRALDEAVSRARSREQFGKPIGENQGLRWMLADASTQLEAARLLTYRAAWLADGGQERVTVESAQAKLFATETAQRVVDLALQVHGGAGTLHGSVVERLYREVRALRIYEGTSEVLRETIGKALLRDAAETPR
ncbi:MAG TPA: acyl-CoA dehydrogenase family protein [Candidatus Thermoplasmatota archaeon]|nr:acyl-CoA dehydrogenase family protein [Candidatus Thermoplasmatota archaeon]